MQVATLLIAVAGVALSAASLSWQAASFYLTGGRVKAELLVGAVHASGTGMVTMPISSGVNPQTPQQLAAQGYNRPVVAVRVRSVGRGAVTVTGWSVYVEGGPALQPTGAIGPNLPHRLDAGETATWAVDAQYVQALRTATAATQNIRAENLVVRARVELGTGRTTRAKEELRG